MSYSESRHYIRKVVREGRATKGGIALVFDTQRSDSADAFERHVENLDGEVWDRKETKVKTSKIKPLGGGGETKSVYENGYRVVAYVDEDIYQDLVR